MPALAVMARLRRIADAHGARGAVAAEDAAWLTAALRRYLADASAGVTLEQALGLAVPAGGAPWWRQEALAARDALLRELAAGFTGAATARAHQLALLLRRYGAVGWRLDRNRGAPMGGGRERELLFRTFALDPDPPTSIRRLYSIITATIATGSTFSLHDKAPTFEYTHGEAENAGGFS